MKIAIVCASGIGDALIFHAAAHAFVQRGWEAATFSDHLTSFGSWLCPNIPYFPQPPLHALSQSFASFDAIFLQHDNSPKAFSIQKLQTPVYTFYGSHVPTKHGILRESQDYVCDTAKTMVANVDLACHKFFDVTIHGAVGLTPPKQLIHRRHSKQIAIHASASTLEKRWPKEKFLKVSKWLTTEGFNPIFLSSPQEQSEWGGPLLHTLEDLTSVIYESGGFLGNDSGPAHLASLLNIPHLVIGGTGLQMPLWTTGWYPGHLIVPPRKFMNLKYLRRKWHIFISTKRVINNLKHNVL